MYKLYNVLGLNVQQKELCGSHLSFFKHLETKKITF